MMRRSLLATVLAVAACMGDGSVTSTSFLAPSSTAAPRLADGGLIPVDPATLVPLPGAEPLIVADHHRGQVSPNGRWAIVESWRSGTQTTFLSIVDLDELRVVNQIDQPQGGATSLLIDDDGTAYWLVHGAATRIVALGLSGTARVVFDDFPPEFAAWGDHSFLGPGLIGVAGVADGGETPGESSTLVIDLHAGSHRHYQLPNVVSGFIGEGGEVDGFPVGERAIPDVTWDRAANRVLVVEATRDVVTEIDLGSGAISEHPWVRPVAFLERIFAWLIPPAAAKGPTTGVTRDAVLVDGRLFIATQVAKVSDGVWSSDSEDLIVIDTGTWTAESVEIPVGALHISPASGHLLAQGVSHGDILQGEPTPIFLIDPNDPGTPLAMPVGGDDLATISFSPSGTMAYAQYWDQGQRIDLIDLTLEAIVGSVQFREMNLIGPAGLMSFHP